MADAGPIARKDADQVLLRLPPGLRARLQAHADLSGRSMNTEIVDAIIKHLEGVCKLDELEQRIAALEDKGTR